MLSLRVSSSRDKYNKLSNLLVSICTADRRCSDIAVVGKEMSMDAVPLYRKISHVVARKLSRALSFNEESSLFADERQISDLNDATLLKVFNYLQISELICVSKVCKKWNHLSSHPCLWQTVDLRRFAKALSNTAQLENVAHWYLANKVVALDVSGFTIPQQVLNTLTSCCPDLRKLVLKSVTFTKEDDDQQVLFPTELEYLDVRYSHGHTDIYQAMAKRFDQLKWLGMCDALILAISNEQTLQQTILSLAKLEKLDMTHCRLVKDNFITKFSSCKRLKLLSLRKCTNICGESLPGLVARLSCLETLILDGASVDDECLQQVDWANTNIKYLEIGWCPLISTDGLQSFLPNMAQISSLEYLGLCRVGQGKAMTDKNLEQLAFQLQRGTCPRLHSLNLSFSDNITDDGLATFENMYHIETLDVTKCVQITTLEEDQDDEVFPIQRKESIGVFEDNSPTNNNVPRVRRRSSRGSFSTIQFALSDYTLETPL